MRLIIGLCLILVRLANAAGGGTIYIIRHGEKKWALGCLSVKGEERAKALVDIFNGKPSATHDTFQPPRAIFANFYDDPIDCERCKQTVTPISEALGIPINFTYGFPAKLGGNTRAAQAMKDSLRAQDGAGVVLTAWEHVNIQFLAEDLGVAKSQVPNWPGTDYDTVYVLEFDSTQRLTSFRVAAENYTPPVLDTAETPPMMMTLASGAAVASPTGADAGWTPWPDAGPRKNIPFPKSTDILGFEYLSGKNAAYGHADTWYPTWAADGNLYTPWTDGTVEGVQSSSDADAGGGRWKHGGNATTGFATVYGDDPFKLNVTSVHTYTSSAWPYKGRYPCGSLAVGGDAATPPTWYYGTYYLDNQNDTSTAGKIGPNPGPNCDKQVTDFFTSLAAGFICSFSGQAHDLFCAFLFSSQVAGACKAPSWTSACRTMRGKRGPRRARTRPRTRPIRAATTCSERLRSTTTR